MVEVLFERGVSDIAVWGELYRYCQRNYISQLSYFIPPNFMIPQYVITFISSLFSSYFSEKLVYSFDVELAHRFGCFVVKDYYPTESSTVFPNVQETIPLKSLIRSLRSVDFNCDWPIALKVFRFILILISSDFLSLYLND